MIKHLRESVKLFGANLLLFMALIVCLGWPRIAAELSLAQSGKQALLLILCVIGTWPLIPGSTLITLSRLGSGKPVTVSSVILDTLPHWIRMMFLCVLLSLALIVVIIPFSPWFFSSFSQFYVIGFLSLFFPSVYVITRMCFSLAIVVLENANPIAACIRSWYLTNGFAWRIFIAGLFCASIFVGDLFMESLIRSSSIAAPRTELLIWELSIPLFSFLPTIFVFLLYREARSGEIAESAKMK